MRFIKSIVQIRRLRVLTAGRWVPASRPAYVWDDSPFLQEPFRYIAAITIALTPDSQLTRTAVGFLRETQAESHIFELGCHCWKGGERPSPVGISSSFVNYGQMSNHTPLVGPPWGFRNWSMAAWQLMELIWRWCREAGPPPWKSGFMGIAQTW